LKLICKFEGATKGLSKILMDKLIDKAKELKKDYIFLESVPNAKYFYKNYGYESDSEKEIYTESEKDETLSGYVLKLNNNKISNIVGGGKIIEQIEYIYQDDFLEIKMNQKVIKKLEISRKYHPIYLYLTLELDTLENKEEFYIFLNILELIAETKYIKSIELYLEFEEYLKNKTDFLEKNGYLIKQQFNNMLIILEKKIHPSYILDRTVLSNQDFD
jgi:hypothetical protein